MLIAIQPIMQIIVILMKLFILIILLATYVDNDPGHDIALLQVRTKVQAYTKILYD